MTSPQLPTRSTPRKRELALLAVLLLVFVMAPTPGDIGGCGQEAELLDAPTFFATKRAIDCRQCEDCGFVYKTCQEVCASNASIPESFATGCFPLVHDGEVCLRALNNASCDDYSTYMADDSEKRSTPSECNFCPAR